MVVTFFALLPPPHVRERLDLAASALHQRSRGRRTKAARLHLTLAYVGATSPEQIVTLSEMASSICVRPFALLLDQVGTWKRNHVAWLGARETPVELQRLQAALSDGMGQLGLRAETRRFFPHVTLARDAKCFVKPEHSASIEWRVDAFSFMRSDADPARYVELRRWPLINL
jgi:RNA 2',3'-cyclic 3'-phosphodiesterase